MVCKITSFNKSRSRAGRLPTSRDALRWTTVSGMTIVEMLIAMGISAIMLTQVCALWFYSTRSFAAQASYTTLDQDSQRALDWLSRDIRQATNVTLFASNRVNVTTLSGQTISFFHDTGKLRRSITAGNTVTLLKDCEWVNFKMYQRTPISGTFDQYPTTNLATCKLIEVNWKCSRRPYPTASEQTEYMQSAKVVLRSKL